MGKNDHVRLKNQKTNKKKRKMQYFLIFGFYTSAMNVGGLTLWFGSPTFIQMLNIFQLSFALRHLCI